MPGASSVEPRVGTAPQPEPRTTPAPFGGPRFPEIGGLATPWGIYLVQGRVTGGVGPAALLMTGFSFGAVEAGALLLHDRLEHLVGLRLPVVSEATLVLMLVLAWMAAFRLTSLAGHHAAEHQVVHAAERGVPLTVDAVGRMERVHPRCGTRLAAAAVMLLGAAIVGESVGVVGYVLGGLLTIRFWPTVGDWLQERLTTREPSPKQVHGAIEALRQLEESGRARGVESPSVLERVAVSGVPWLLAGAFLAAVVVEAGRFVLRIL